MDLHERNDAVRNALREEIPTGPYAHMTYEQRFKRLVKKGRGCWTWTGKLFPNGYGQFHIRGKDHLAHRVSAIIHGLPVDEAPVIRHDCDNRTCVNPNHLRVGTQEENMHDMSIRNRANPLKGADVWQAKLTPQKVKSIRRSYKDGTRQVDLAAEYGVSAKQISVIVNRKQWAHI